MTWIPPIEDLSHLGAAFNNGDNHIYSIFGIDLATYHFSLHAVDDYKKSPLLPCAEDGSDLKFDAQ
ncbi:hypothetical protein [Salinivibrio proteolyticus]|uniref:hypothetical protein n=1 Tax=Salinivibrio proteolyticus TaxID=334715 RepID=UPI000989226C|nr:hypothetical protein [Salinivibrio proteolyticus]OOF30118.1 hypothetical protein BZJ20_11790 [Salinivibrio proteolyticus]